MLPALRYWLPVPLCALILGAEVGLQKIKFFVANFPVLECEAICYGQRLFGLDFFAKLID